MTEVSEPPAVGDELAARRNGATSDDAPAADPPAGDAADDLTSLEGQLVLPGVSELLDMRAGKGRPSSSEFRLRAVGLPLRGQLDVESRVVLLVVATVDDVGVTAKRKGENVAERVRRHVATPQSVRVLEDYELAALDDAYPVDAP